MASTAELERLRDRLERYEADLQGVKAQLQSQQLQQPTGESREELKRLQQEKQSLLDLIVKLQEKENLLLGSSAGAAAAAMSECVSKIMVDDQCVGTLVRITPSGLCVSASHVLVDQGKFLQQATAFGGAALRLRGSSPSHDVVFVQGPSGSSFDLRYSPLVVGLSVTLLAHPLAPQLDLSTPEHPVTLPTVAQGHVVAVAPSGELAAADYHGAMPSSSGGAVLVDSIHFAGLHLGTSYHLDTTHMHDEEEPVADPSRWDTDPAAMWQGAASRGSQGKRPAAGDPDVATAANQLQALVLHAANNIAHKDQLAVFVPATTIIRLAQHHKLLGLSDMEVVQRQHVARSQH